MPVTALPVEYRRTGSFQVVVSLVRLLPGLGLAGAPGVVVPITGRSIHPGSRVAQVLGVLYLLGRGHILGRIAIIVGGTRQGRPPDLQIVLLLLRTHNLLLFGLLPVILFLVLALFDELFGVI